MVSSGTVTMRQIKLTSVLVIFMIVMVIIYLTWTPVQSPDGSTSRQMDDISVLRLGVSQQHIVKMSNDTTFQQLKMALQSEGLVPFITPGGEIISTNTEGEIIIPSATILNTMKINDLEELYHRFLENVQVICKKQFHIGNIYDGGYDICEDAKVIPTQPCLAYSFGIRDDFSFDEQLADAFHCEVHAFDPNNGLKDHKHSENIYFHATGLSDKDGVINKDWRMRTLDSVRSELGHTQRMVDVLKIDIESGEWIVLPDILHSQTLTGVRQLIMEFHTWTHYGNVHIDGRTKDKYVNHLVALKGIHDLGFRIFFFRRFHSPSCKFIGHDGRQKTGCLEVHFLQNTTPRREMFTAKM